jgi:hypothetical protein
MDSPTDTATSPTMPVRSNSDEIGTDPSDPLYARFKSTSPTDSLPPIAPPPEPLPTGSSLTRVAWRGVIGNLLEYFEQLESFHKQKSKEYTKLSKTPEVPFKTPEFAPNGIALIYQALRDKNLQLANYHAEEATLLKAGTIADLGRLRADLKKHLGDLEKEGIKGSRKVEKKMDKFVHTFTVGGLTFLE